MHIGKSTMSVAFEVLAVLERLDHGLHLSSDSTSKIDLHLESYSNGREQGFCLTAFCWSNEEARTLRISFSNDRHSDGIVVYTGEGFSLQGNCPPDAVYRNKQLFAYDEAYQAAEWITQQINALINTVCSD